MKTAVICLVLLAVVTGCVPLEKRVQLSNETSVNLSGGSGRLFVSPRYDGVIQKVVNGWLLGRVGETGTSIVTSEDPSAWIATVLAGQLGGAGYEVVTGGDAQGRAPKGVRLTILAFSANQTHKVLTISTVAEIKVVAELFQNGRLVKSVTAGARDEEEGIDRSSWPIQLALQKTLEQVLQQLVSEIVNVLK